MKYVDWVETVVRATVEAFDAGNGFATTESAVVEKLGLDLGEEQREPLWDAFRDLQRMGLLESASQWDIQISQEARKTRVVSLRTSWGKIHETWIEPRQASFLAKLCEMSEQRAERWAHLEPVQGDDVLTAIGETPTRAESVPLIMSLEKLGLVDASHMTMGSFLAFPTYFGLVLATEKVATTGQKLILDLLEDWETTNVDFKREIHLATKDDKAEFVRDVLALANTQVTGDRHLVSGFEPKTRAFTTPVDPRITQDTIENILNEFTKPPATVLYKAFPWIDGSGDVGLIEVVRDRSKVPYRVSRRLAGERKAIEEGDVYVRHSSHVAKASPAEIGDLEAEGARARGESMPAPDPL